MIDPKYPCTVFWGCAENVKDIAFINGRKAIELQVAFDHAFKDDNSWTLLTGQTEVPFLLFRAVVTQPDNFKIKEDLHFVSMTLEQTLHRATANRSTRISQSTLGNRQSPLLGIHLSIKT